MRHAKTISMSRWKQSKSTHHRPSVSFIVRPRQIGRPTATPASLFSNPLQTRRETTPVTERSLQTDSATWNQINRSDQRDFDPQFQSQSSDDDGSTAASRAAPGLT